MATDFIKRNEALGKNISVGVDALVINFLADYENKKISLGELWSNLYHLQEESGQKLEGTLKKYGDTITLWLLHTFETTFRPLW